MVTTEEQPRFVCPACGRSFKVRSWYSERIFCGKKCSRYAHEHGLVAAGVYAYHDGRNPALETVQFSTPADCTPVDNSTLSDAPNRAVDNPSENPERAGDSRGEWRRRESNPRPRRLTDSEAGS